MKAKEQVHRKIKAKPSEVIQWFLRLITQPTAHKEIRMKRKGAMQWFMK